jgi:hypothetical protein
VRGLMLAIAFSLIAGTSAFACGSLPPGTLLPPGTVPPRGSLPPGVVPPTSNNPSPGDIALIEGFLAGTLTPADRQRVIELVMQDAERKLRSAALADTDMERARALLQQIRTLLERGEMQLARDIGREFERLIGSQAVPTACGGPRPVVPPQAAN